MGVSYCDCSPEEGSLDALDSLWVSDDDSAALTHLRSGNPVYISGGNEFPGKAVRLSPNGTRHLVHFDLGVETVEQEISPIVPTWFQHSGLQPFNS